MLACSAALRRLGSRGELRDVRRLTKCLQLGLIWMPVNLSIKNALDDIVERLWERAAQHHRSLQGELLAMIEEAARQAARLTPRQVLAEVRRLGLETRAEAAEIVRAHRDGR